MFYKKRRGVAKPKKTIYKRRRGILLKKMPVVSVNAVKTMVKKEIAKNVENKLSSVNSTDGYIGYWVTGAPSPVWYKKTFMADLDLDGL